MNAHKPLALLDAFDALSACETPDEIWQCAMDLSQSLGVSALNTALIDVAQAGLVWARSSMDQTWLDRYMEMEFWKIDPLIKLFSKQNSRKTIFCDPVSIENGDHGGHVVLSKALNEAGYALLHGTTFTTKGAPFGKIVTLCFKDIERDAFLADLSSWTTLSALIAGFDMAPDGSADLNVFAQQGPQLSKREKQVLSYLASGMKVARIADQLGLAEITIGKHLRTARHKLGCRTREQALIKAMQLGLLDLR